MDQRPLAAIILAAGKGTRMKTALPKCLHPVCGVPMVEYVIDAARKAGAQRILVVVGYGADQMRTTLEETYQGQIEFAEQLEQLGTGHAVMCCAPLLEGFEGDVLVLAGDTPAITAPSLAELIGDHVRTSATASLATFKVDNPAGYGRITRGGGLFSGIVEHKDASEEIRAIKEVNAGVYVFQWPFLMQSLPELGVANAQGEYYLTDVLSIALAKGELVTVREFSDEFEFSGVNDLWQLAMIEQSMNKRTIHRLCISGVRFIAPETTLVGPHVHVAPGVTVNEGTRLYGHTEVGEGSLIGPHTVLHDVVVGSRTSIVYSWAHKCSIGEDCKIGPFANIRPHSKIGSGCKVGNFVELKNADLEGKVAISHLSYIGDASVGRGTNVGAGTITCNYDGYSKHRTSIGEDVFVGSNSTLVAPVTIGDRAMVAAGSVVTVDVPDDGAAFGRARTEIKEKWVTLWRQRKREQNSREWTVHAAQNADQ